MAKHWPLFAALLLVAPARAQVLPELSSIVFSAEPLSSEPKPAAVSARPPSPRAAHAPTKRGTVNDDFSADITKHLAAVDAEEARTGERSATLIEPLQSLAATYRAAGDYAAAIATLERAIWILRINSGLFSLDQADVVETLLATRRESGHETEAATLEGYLQELATRNPEDVRVSGLLGRLADAEMTSARELIDEPPPAQLNLIMTGTVLTPAPIRSPPLKALLAARRHYAEAIIVGTRNGTESPAELIALEEKFVDTLYFELMHPRLRYYEDGPTRLSKYVPLWSVGERMLKSKLRATTRLTQSPVATAKAMIELGDWYLMFAVNGAALEQYKAAHDLLVAQNVPQTTIEEIVSPEVPPVLPVLSAAPETEDLPHHGYVEAAVEVGPYGNLRNIDILATSPGTPKIMEKRLDQYLERSRFRPRLVAGEPARSDRFSARFYYAY